MRYEGRLSAIGVVGLFNVLRYYYYHEYYGIPFKGDFFILTAIFLLVAWWAGKQYDRAKYYSEKDPLTNTYNRRTVEKYFLKHAKENHRLGIIMMDLNNFKQINDTYGHHKGDELIVYFTSALSKLVNKNDMLARWGGDEFLILSPNIDEDFELNYVNHLHQELENHNFEHYPLVGASIGVAIYPAQGKKLQELIQVADKAMYEAKGLKIKVQEESLGAYK